MSPVNEDMLVKDKPWITESGTGLSAVRTDYKCPSCNFMILMVFIRKVEPQKWRWTCEHCRRDFCYNTPEPCLERDLS